MLKKIFFIISVTFIIIIGILAYIFIDLSKTLGTESNIIVIVRSNSSFSTIVKEFNKKDVLKPGYLYIPLIKFYSIITSEKIKPGTYRFNSSNKNYDIIRSIFSGKQLALVKVTFPEGISLSKFASISAKKLNIDSAVFVKISNADSTKKKFGIKAKSIEGYFYPATYNFFWECNPADIIDELLENSNKHWENKFSDIAEKQNKNRHEILTLASIIEAETPVVSERKRIAGVYMNRLRKGMKLEADPTVQYAIGEKKKLNYNDLNYDSPYNTYFYKGLPPGPINSPSLASIEAALNPEKNDFIYFVAVGDGSGKHNFARNFSQHQKFRKEYKFNRQQNN